MKYIYTWVVRSEYEPTSLSTKVFKDTTYQLKGASYSKILLFKVLARYDHLKLTV